MKLRAILIGPLFLLISLLVVRHQIISDMGVAYGDAFSHGVGVGILYDLFAATLPTIFAVFLCRFFKKIDFSTFWMVLAFFVWLPAYSNASYFRFFEGRLQWWVVQYYTSDLFDFSESVGAISLDLSMIAGIAFLVLSLLFTYLWRRELPTPSNQHIVKISLISFALILGGVTLLEKNEKTIAGKQVFKIWLEPLIGSLRDVADQPSNALAAYRDWNQARSSETLNDEWPLLKWFHPTYSETMSLRKELGLPTDQPIHVVVVFVESFRAFDLDHPETGPKVFPRFRKLVAKHGVYFSQAYSSAGIAGMTARGQFSTGCSMLPNMMGPGTYLAQENLRAICLPSVLKKSGYQTAWFHTLNKTYHNSVGFESRHGIDLFFDREHFLLAPGVKERNLVRAPDGPFLRETLRVLEEMDRKSKEPFYSSILTFSSHHPFVPIPEGPLPAELVEATKDFPEYHGFLSKFRYADESLGNFIEELFSGSIGDRTLLVVLGDHGVTIKPHIPLNARQKKELRYRVPIAFLTKKNPNPKRIQSPVHQVDVAPTIATIVGAQAKVTWVGKNILRGPGSPWLTLEESGLAYRTEKQACYTFISSREPECFDVSHHQDPLFDEVHQSAHQPKTTAFFRKVLFSNTKMISKNLVLPIQEISFSK